MAPPVYCRPILSFCTAYILALLSGSFRPGDGRLRSTGRRAVQLQLVADLRVELRDVRTEFRQLRTLCVARRRHQTHTVIGTHCNESLQNPDPRVTPCYN